MKKIKRIMRKKAAAAIAITLAGLLLAPPAALAGETKTYTGVEPLQTIGGYANSFGPTNLTNVSGNKITINYSSGPSPDIVWGAYSSSADVSDNTVTIGGGTVDSVRGGQSNSGNSIGNTSIISGGSVSFLFGGVSPNSGSAIGNRVTISGGHVSQVVGGYAYIGNASDNTVTISGGTMSLVHGGRSIIAGNAAGNSVTISGGSVSINVVGGDSYSGSATGNTVTVSGTPTLNGILFGGYKASGSGDVWTGNTLNVKNSNMAAKGVANFQYYNFYLPTALAAGGAMLSVTNAADIHDSTIGIRFLGGTSLQTGDTVTLLHSGSTINAVGINAQARGLIGIARIYDFALSTNANTLYATVAGVRQNSQVKALSEGQISGAAFLNQGADMLTGQSLQNARGAAAGAGGQSTGFAALGGSSLRYETGSHVDVSGVSLVIGAAQETATEKGTLTRGLFLEHGRGNYSTYNSFSDAASVKGEGNTSYLGAGWLGRWQKNSGHYLEGSLRAGRVSNKFGSNDIGTAGTHSSFDVSAPYYGLHIGLGKETNLGKNSKRDVYAKLLWTHQNGSNAAVQGDDFRFAAVDSLRSLTGVKWSYKSNETTTLRTGVAYQYEFGGKANATVNGSAVEAPGMKGGTGILEVGLTKESKDGKGATLDIGLQGFCGKTRGMGATVQAAWKF